MRRDDLLLTKLNYNMCVRRRHTSDLRLADAASKGLAFEEQEGGSVLNVLDALVRRALCRNDALLST